jgi:hypothetical protein
MKINELKQRAEIDQNTKSKEAYLQFEKLLNELRKKELPDATIEKINRNVEEVNSVADSGKTFRKKTRENQTRIIKTLEKEQKIVPKNYYRNIWMAIGMAAFGLPIGVAFGAALENMAFLAIGLPIGMTIGIGVGARMDKKALSEGRQLDIEIKN